jgi:hypothetical protein
MKKLVIALTLVIVLVTLMVTPVMAARGPYFSTRLTSDDDRLPGMLVSQFIFNTEGVSGILHTMGLMDTKTNLELDGLYPFCLDADTDQEAALTSYFGAKDWPAAYDAQIALEISGDAPFFYLKAYGGTYTLIDGFVYGLGGGEVPLRIDDDYPVGLYVYAGGLGELEDVNVTLKVMRWGSGFSSKKK